MGPRAAHARASPGARCAAGAVLLSVDGGFYSGGTRQRKAKNMHRGIQATGCDHWPTRRPPVGCKTLQRRVRVRRVTNQRHLGLACITSRHDGLEWLLRPTSRGGHAQIAAHERDRGRAMTALQAAARESRTTHGPKLPAPDDLWRGPITRPRSASSPPLMAKPCGQSVP